MKKFENWLILAAIVFCGYAAVSGGEDMQATAICSFMGAMVFKYICVEADKARRQSQQMGEPWKRNNDNNNG